MNAITQNTKITSTDINKLISECNNKLSLSGGTLTGPLYTPGYGCITSENTTEQKSLALFGCSSKRETCASINLKSIEDPNEAGYFYINAKDDTNGKSLVGTPSGSLTWNGNDVITSAGGTFKSNVYFKNSSTKIWDFSSTSYKGFEIAVGGQHEQTGASLNLYHKDSSNSPGAFFITAANGTNKSSLYGSASGSLTWNGNEVATNNIVPSAVVNEVHPVTNKLCVIKASADNAPNNGCILSYSISNPNWIGQLFIGDNATQGLYYRGASNGEWCAWKKVFIATEEGRLQFPNYTEMWIA